MSDPYKTAPPPFEPRQEYSQVTWPNAADAGGLFAAAGIGDSGGLAGGFGGDNGNVAGGASGDSGSLFLTGLNDWGGLHGVPAGDFSWLGSAAYGDFMALYPGAHMDHGYLLIPFGPDSGQPSYLTLDATGKVGADFSGHLQASGVDLAASVSTSPPSDNQIRWINTLGEVVSSAYGYYDNTNRYGQFAGRGHVLPTGTDPLGMARIQACTPGGTPQAELAVTHRPNAPGGLAKQEVSAVAGTFSKILINDLEGSDYLFSGGPAVQCKITAAGTQVVTAGVAATPITFAIATEIFDQGSPVGQEMHDGTNPTRFTARKAGIYMIDAGGSTNVAMTGTPYVFLRKNGAGVEKYGTVYQAQGLWMVQAVSKLAAGDYIEVVYQNGTGNTVTLVTAQMSMAEVKR